MIRLKAIHIEEFRGIKDLSLDLGGKSFGICGPNGTGKSGVVDAIEFCLTGSLTRLSGQGQGELSVAKHGPHVDSRTAPEKAKVEITAYIPSLGKDVIIARSVKSPKQVSVTPSGGAEEEIVTSLQAHPEFALSRREIAKYIITPPSQRSTDVQNLLRLDRIGDLRKVLNTFKNNAAKEARDATGAKSKAEQDLKTALGVDTLKRETVLEKANEHRKVLGLPDLTELTPETIFIGAVEDEKEEEGGQQSALVKSVALADLKALTESAVQDEPDALSGARSDALTALNKLREDSAALTLARQHGFITTGLEFISDESEACPLCDTPWEAEALRAHLEEKLISSDAIGKILKKLDTDFQTIEQAVEDRIADLRTVASYAKALEPAVPIAKLATYAARLKQILTMIKDFSEDHAQLDPAITAIQDAWWALPGDVQALLEELRKAIAALPDSSAKDKAIQFLTVLQERYTRLIEANRSAKESAQRSITAEKVYDHYVNTSNEVLEDIYDAVAKEFTALYKAINDDEGNFVGELKAEPAKLSFNVDFYGRGTFPPGAYHSEGHQDGMGLCLYLALMQHTLGDKFTFAVLDDVMMSVDTGHRREVCRLLKTRFPNTQFVLTTHDRVWLQYMKTEKLIAKSQLFGGWSVEFGPRIWDDQDIWTEIDQQLDKNDVPRAAWLLRRYLSYIATVLADNLRAQVEFRGDGHYDLGDLLPPVLKRWQDRLDKGIKAAAHWGNDEEKSILAEKRDKSNALIAATYVEQWTINPSVHFNEWENFESGEFAKVVAAYKLLLESMRCANEKCGTLPYVVPRKGSSVQLRCDCQSININLKGK